MPIYCGVILDWLRVKLALSRLRVTLSWLRVTLNWLRVTLRVTLSLLCRLSPRRWLGSGR